MGQVSGVKGDESMVFQNIFILYLRQNNFIGNKLHFYEEVSSILIKTIDSDVAKEVQH